MNMRREEVVHKPERSQNVPARCREQRRMCFQDQNGQGQAEAGEKHSLAKVSL